jgi:signal transduction histidine kinase
MVGAIAVMAALGYWDEQRESAAALEDFAQEQADLAASAAHGVSTRLDAARRDALRFAEDASAGRPTPAEATLSYASARLVGPGAPASPAAAPGAIVLRVPLGPDTQVELTLPATALLEEAARIERPRELLVLLARADVPGLTTRDGRGIGGSPVEAAFRAGQSTARLSRPEAAELGLPPRVAVAGVAAVDGGTFGRFGVAVVASAAKERDRESRARYRLLLGVVLTGGLVLFFGAVALRKQRHELELQRELELAELQQRRDERLERASRAAMMGTLAAGIAHELSTPLGVVSGRAEQLAGRVKGDERASRAVAVVLEQTERMSAIIRGFLDFARGGSPTLTRASPADLAKGAVRLVEHRFEKLGVRLLLHLGEALPSVHCDVHLLEHALVNLLLNACEACERGGTVELSLRETDGRVVFEVVDDGAGIAPADVSRVTEPFFSTKPPGAGTGLGLAITSEIVKGHRGSLTLAPRASGGTSATLALPLDESPAAAPSKKAG